jgi:hypothetical protein
MTPRVSLREALADINLLGNALAGESLTFSVGVGCPPQRAATHNGGLRFTGDARGAHGERRGDRYRHTLHAGFDDGPAEPALGLERRARNVTPSLGQYLAARTAPATGDAPSMDAEGTE